jgi:hypothetical protein
MRWLDPGEIRLGRQVREQSSVFGRSLVTVTKVTELEPGRRIKVETVSGLTPVVSIRTCEPDGGGTRFTYSLEADVSGVWFFRLLQPVLIPYYNRQMKGYLQRLKQVLEAA